VPIRVGGGDQYYFLFEIRVKLKEDPDPLIHKRFPCMVRGETDLCVVCVEREKHTIKSH
jgi:hypothetical protein